MSLLSIARNLSRFGGFLEIALLAICASLLTAIFVCVFTGVVVRYVLMVPWAWTEEIARYCLVWFAPMAAAVGVRRGSHFTFQWALMPLAPHMQKLIRQIGNVLIILFLVLFAKLSFGFLAVMENQTSFATELDMRIPASGLVVGYSTLIIMYALELADAALAVFTKHPFSLRELQEIENMNTLKSGAHSVQTAAMPAVPAE
jgi:TRAP-type C4-dicarboxylate transport system permease small subunit